MTTGTFHSKVAGVTADNPDGLSRQLVIEALCRKRKPLLLHREPNNKFDKNAVGVWIEGRRLIFWKRELQVGYLNADIAGEIARYIDNGNPIHCEITEITGGTRDKPSFGVNILIVKG